MNKDWFDQKSHIVLLGMLMILSYFLLMFGNSIVSLTHPDEVFYIQSAKEMLAYNSWLTPMIFDDIQFEKPFLPFVLFMIAIKIFGLTAFAGRFFPSLFGIIGVGVVYWIAWSLFKSKRISVLSGLILSSSFIYLALSRAVLTDMIFSVFISISIGWFIFAYHNRKYKRIGIVLWLAFSAIAVLTKGLLGILFPIAPVIMFLIYKKDFSFLKCRSILEAIVLFLLISVPWHVLMYRQHGFWFLEEYFYNVHWRRILMSEHERLDNWHFYIMLIVVGVMPWFLFWIPAVRCIIRQFKKKLASRDKLFFLCAWVFSVYIFVQPAHSKLASYIFPLFPSAAIILAYAINNALVRHEQGESLKLFKVMAYIMSALLVIVSIGGIFVARMYPKIIVDMMPIYLAAVLFSFVALLIFIFNKKKMYIQMVFSYLGVTITLLISLFFARPFIEPWVSCKEISEIFNSIDQSDSQVIASKFYVRGIRYYTDRPMAVIDIRGKGFWSPHPIPFFDSHNEMVTYLNQGPKVTWAIVKEGNVIDIKRMLVSYNQYKINEIHGVGGKYILKIVRSD